MAAAKNSWYRKNQPKHPDGTTIRPHLILNQQSIIQHMAPTQQHPHKSGQQVLPFKHIEHNKYYHEHI
jgi:hypothetical protein